jgi:vitamin-K-epoxide reductase (warfarin-sensitive)
MQPSVSGTVNRNRILFSLVAVLSLVGVVDSAIALQRHYAKSATNFCDFSQNFSCDIVNRSEYSTILDIPVAAIGVVGYAALFLLSTFWRSRPEAPNGLLALAIGGLGFALYLTYVEAYLLKTWCILCVLSLALILAITGVVVAIRLRAGTA